MATPDDGRKAIGKIVGSLRLPGFVLKNGEDCAPPPECEHGSLRRQCLACQLMEDAVEACHGWAIVEEALRAALAHETHQEGKCGCCWTDKAEKALRAVRGDADA